MYGLASLLCTFCTFSGLCFYSVCRCKHRLTGSMHLEVAQRLFFRQKPCSINRQLVSSSVLIAHHEPIKSLQTGSKPNIHHPFFGLKMLQPMQAGAVRVQWQLKTNMCSDFINVDPHDVEVARLVPRAATQEVRVPPRTQDAEFAGTLANVILVHIDGLAPQMADMLPGLYNSHVLQSSLCFS